MPLSKHSGGCKNTAFFVSLCGDGEEPQQNSLDKCDNFPPFHALQCSQLWIHFSAIPDNAWVPVTPADSVTTGCE